MPADFMQSLLSGELGSDMNDPNTADRAAKLNAITQYLRNGNTEPTAVESPSYGPIGGILQNLGIRKRFQPVSPQLSNEMWLGGQVEAGEKSGEQMKKLGAIQDWGTQFGTKSAREMSGTIGAPEIGADLPEGVKGQGELRISAQDLKMQQMMMSHDVKEQELGNKQYASELRAAASENNSARLQGLADLQERRTYDTEQHMEEQPVNQMVQDTMGDLRAEESHLQTLQANSVDPTQQAAYEKQIGDIRKRRRGLISGRGGIKTSADLAKILYGDDSEPTPTKGGVKPPAATMSFE